MLVIVHTLLVHILLQGHDDWLFDVTWLTDDVLVTGNVNSKIHFKISIDCT